MTVFLVPAHLDNARTSLSRPADLYHLRRALNCQPQYEEVIAAAKGHPIYCWAMRQSKLSVFRRMTPGDEVIFAITGSGEFNYVGTLFHKAESPTFASQFWNTSLLDWPLVYFLKDVETLSVNKTDCLVALGYDSTDRLQGARPVRDHTTSAILRKHGSVRKF